MEHRLGMHAQAEKENLVRSLSRRGARKAATRSSGSGRPLGIALAASLLASLAFSASALADHGHDRLGSSEPAAVRLQGAGQRRPRRPGRPDQARLGDRAREQGLQRQLDPARGHAGPVPQRAARPGRAADQLLRHRSLEPRQLPVDGQRPGAGHRHRERLPRIHHDERRLRHPARDGELRSVRVGRGRQRAGR